METNANSERRLGRALSSQRRAAPMVQRLEALHGEADGAATKGRHRGQSSDSGETQAAPEQSAAKSVPARSLSVWERLKQHKVAQWTLAYAAAAYTLLQGTEMVSDAFESAAPARAHRAVLLLLGCRWSPRSPGTTAIVGSSG